MIVSLPIDLECPAAWRADIPKMVAKMQAVGGKIRIINVPYDELVPIIERAGKGATVPFCPTLCGIPVQVGPAGIDSIQVIATHDDDTNVHMDNRRREIDAFNGRAA